MALPYTLPDSSALEAAWARRDEKYARRPMPLSKREAEAVRLYRTREIMEVDGMSRIRLARVLSTWRPPVPYAR